MPRLPTPSAAPRSALDQYQWAAITARPPSVLLCVSKHSIHALSTPWVATAFPRAHRTSSHRLRRRRTGRRHGDDGVQLRAEHEAADDWLQLERLAGRPGGLD